LSMKFLLFVGDFLSHEKSDLLSSFSGIAL